jgi:putative addiction module component (TIGR02574 family)
MTLADIPQINDLTAEEKLQLVGDIWDSIGVISDELPVSEEEKTLLDARLHAHLQSPESGLTFEEFKKQLSSRL